MLTRPVYSYLFAYWRLLPHSYVLMISTIFIIYGVWTKCHNWKSYIAKSIISIFQHHIASCWPFHVYLDGMISPQNQSCNIANIHNNLQRCNYKLSQFHWIALSSFLVDTALLECSKMTE